MTYLYIVNSFANIGPLDGCQFFSEGSTDRHLLPILVQMVG